MPCILQITHCIVFHLYLLINELWSSLNITNEPVCSHTAVWLTWLWIPEAVLHTEQWEVPVGLAELWTGKGRLLLPVPFEPGRRLCCLDAYVLICEVKRADIMVSFRSRLLMILSRTIQRTLRNTLFPSFISVWRWKCQHQRGTVAGMGSAKCSKWKP